MSAPDFEALLARHEASYQSDGDYGELQWVECSCGSDQPEDTDGYGSGFRAHLAAEIRREVREWLATIGGPVIERVLLDEGGVVGSSLHSWRCEYPDRYGPCNCIPEVAGECADALASLLGGEG